MTTFVVMEHGGEYEHKWSKPIFASPDEEKAKAHVEEMKRRDAAHKERVESLVNFRQRWEEQNPGPTAEEYHDIPRWGSGLSDKDITPAMREERADLRAKNAAIASRYSEKLKIWQAMSVAAQVEFLLKREPDLPPKKATQYAEAYLGYGVKDHEYEIVPVPG